MDVNTRVAHVSPYKLGEAVLELEILYAHIRDVAFGVLATFFAVRS